MGININILSNGQNKKNEIVITEIIEFMEIQLNILENNKERYKNIDSISEWIIKYQKFHENFKNLNYEWKIFEKYLNVSPFKWKILIALYMSNINNIYYHFFI